ncbi:MAG: uracil-DNA glycosylase [Phototrophicaceae bacterium]
MTFIEDIIERLSQEKFNNSDVYNQYAPDDANNAIRRDNFKRYLNLILAQKPKHLMVMEAPGYRGCRLTGIPVTSYKIMLEGLDNLEIFGEEKGYHASNDEGFENIYGEQSATIVWTTLNDLQITPLIWNTFPFHPHKLKQARTNRKPRVAETKLGLSYLHPIIEFFKPEVIIAVGNVAHDTMSKGNINCHKVRHPAQGGKNDFVAGLQELLR